MESSDIGLNSEVQLALCSLGIGTTVAIFQIDGGLPQVMEWLNRLVIKGAIALAVDFSIVADMPSGPFALDTSSDCNILQISSSVHKLSGKQMWSLSSVMVLIGCEDAY